jgi:hypothetical protein
VTPARQLFHQLSQIEVKHQDRILEQYTALTGRSVTRDTFEARQVSAVLEGGLTTEEYANLLMPAYDTVTEIIELAMSIEAQALDLYLRASRKGAKRGGQKSPDPDCQRGEEPSGTAGTTDGGNHSMNKTIGADRRRPCPHGHAGQPGHNHRKRSWCHRHRPIGIPLLLGHGAGNAIRHLPSRRDSLCHPACGRKTGGNLPAWQSGHDRSRKKIVILENGQTVPYDVLSCNAGSHVPKPAIEGEFADIYTVKPIERLMEAKAAWSSISAGTRRMWLSLAADPLQPRWPATSGNWQPPPAGTCRASPCVPAATSCPAFPHRSAKRSPAY